jgi:beta-barrel assembly-enhancing protease
MHLVKKKTFLICVCVSLCFIPQLVISQTKFYTKRLHNELRKGPANYYPLVGIVPQNTGLAAVKTEEGWTQILLDEKLAKSLETQSATAWISKNCLLEKPLEQPNRQLKISTTVATPSSVAAAIRGFAIRFKRTPIKNVDALLKKNYPCFTQEEYRSFVRDGKVKQLAVVDNEIQEQYARLCSAYDESPDESIIGFNVAAEIASKGLVNNLPLEQYVNLIGTLITQRSNLYDRSFRFYLLDSPKPEAYSTPGGIVLISMGLLHACTSEAELAAILAHEITHVIQHHGMKEMRQRAHKIKAEEAFADLDHETMNVADSTEAGLEEYMQQAYDSAVKPRLLKYEEEADQGSIVLMVLTGYDPNAVSSIIKRIPSTIPREENDLEENPFAKREYEQRAQAVASFLNKYFRSVQGATNSDRFNKFCR